MPLRPTAFSFLQSGKALLLCAMALIAWSFTSTAHASGVQWSVGVNSGGYYAPQPGVQVQIGNGRHYQPAPQVIVVPQAPVYMAPAPVYVTPAPVYRPGRGYHRPPPRHGHRGHDRGRDRHHHRH